VIGNSLSGTHVSQLHDTLNVEPIEDIIQRLIATLCATCPSHPKSLVQNIGDYTLNDLSFMNKNINIKESKHNLL
jgi:hypothetical protein